MKPLVTVMAFAATGCMTVPNLPPYDPEQLENVSEIDIAVQIDVWTVDQWRNRVALMPDWSGAARDQVINRAATRFATDGFVVSRSDARPRVPWRLKSTTAVEPFALPGCVSPVDATEAVARLEVVAIQTIKTPLQRAYDSGMGMLASVVPTFWPILPAWLAYSFGSGETAVRFCLFQAGTSETAWAYAEWFHGGLDLRDPANVEQLVSRAREHYRAALAKKRKATE